MASRSTTTAARLLFPTAPPRCDRSDERLLPRAPRRHRCRRASAARVQDPARAADPQPGAPLRRGLVHLRRAARRPKQGDDSRGPSLPLAPRAAALRPLRARRLRAWSSTRSFWPPSPTSSGSSTSSPRSSPPRGRRCGTSASPSAGSSPIASTGAARQPGMALFFLMNNAALALRGPLLVLLTSGLGVHYVRLQRASRCWHSRSCASPSPIPGSGRRRPRARSRRGRPATTSTASSVSCRTPACPSSSASG